MDWSEKLNNKLFSKAFGFRFSKVTNEKEKSYIPQIIAPLENNDGAIFVEKGTQCANYSLLLNTDDIYNIHNEFAYINQYRQMAQDFHCAIAISEIVNSAILLNENKPPVTLNIGNEFIFSDRLADLIRKEFKEILRLLDFKKNGANIFRQWFIDGKLYYYCIIDLEHPEEGIKKLQKVDPRCIRKIKEVTHNKVNLIDYYTDEEEYYIYNPYGIYQDAKTVSAMPITNNVTRIEYDDIAYCSSGLYNAENTISISYLQLALKPFMQLTQIEDASIIYRLARSPERLVFNIDVADIPSARAKEMVQSIADTYSSKMVYDPYTGQVTDDRQFATMTQNYFFGKRSDGSGTTVEQLPGGANLSEIEDILYFKRNLYQALMIPISRIYIDGAGGGSYSIGRATEITREELKFSSHIANLRHKFSDIFLELLKRQLILKKITTVEDWEYIKENIYFDYISDSYYAELKNTELWRERFELANTAKDFIEDGYMSKNFIQKNFLNLNDDDKELIDQELESEIKEGEVNEEDVDVAKFDDVENEPEFSPSFERPSFEREKPERPEPESTTPEESDFELGAEEPEITPPSSEEI